MTDSLGTLLRNTWRVFCERKVPILVGSLLFGVIFYGVHLYAQTEVDSYVSGTFGDLERMEELAERIEDGDQEAFMEMMNTLGAVGQDGVPNPELLEEKAETMFKSMLPLFAVGFLGALIISIIASTYFLVVAMYRQDSVTAALKRTPKLILPMLGLTIWTVLRSFVWVPFVGIILVIIIGPRLVLSSIILVHEGKGVFESTRLSYERTKGHWGKIVGNLFVASLVAMLIACVCLFVAGLAGMASFALGGILVATTQNIATAYGTIFLVQLGQTVFAHPNNR